MVGSEQIFVQLGFLLGSINEAKTAVPILDQAKLNPIYVGGIVMLFTWASLIPIIKGARSEAFGKLQAWRKPKCGTFSTVVYAQSSIPFLP